MTHYAPPPMPSASEVGTLLRERDVERLSELVAVGSLHDAVFHHLPTGDVWPLGKVKALGDVKYRHETADGQIVEGEAPADVWLRQYRRVDV